MGNKILHITNGETLTERLKQLEFHSTILTWQEMLCEGPTTYDVEKDLFFKLRENYLAKTYDIEVNKNEFEKELSKLSNHDQYDEIVLWFDYNLFSHINLIAITTLISQRKINLPLYLVCSGRIKGYADLKGLPELNNNQLQKHYQNRIQLKKEDIELTKTLWGIYCGKDHNLFKPYIVNKSSFEYLGNCLKAHLMRFPDTKTGLGTLEKNILKLIRQNDIKSKHHLLGYALNYQGYYGYSHLQFERLINNLMPFILKSKDGLSLNDLGNDVLAGKINGRSHIFNNIDYGGVSRTDYSFDEKQNKLIPYHI